MILTDEYKKKVNSCSSAIDALGVGLSDIVIKYKNIYFPKDGPEKFTCIQQIIAGELSTEIYDYLEKECSLPHFQDSRAAYEYAIDLVLGWLIEDAVLLLLSDKGKKAILSGEDRFREFLNPRKISTQPDIRFRSKAGEKMLEIFADWKGTWRNKNHADLRDNKFAKLREHKAVMLGIAPLSEEGFLIDFSEDSQGFTQSFIPAYRKMGYSHKDIRSHLMPLSLVIVELLAL